MTIQHKDIPDSLLHEPKGVASATSGSVYSANGLGSGVWKRVSTDMLSGSSGDLGVAGKKFLTNGTNGVTLVADGLYGAMTITNNTNAFSVPTAVDSTLNTNSDYVLFTSTGAPWLPENLNGLTFNTDRLTATVSGVYRIDLWSNITQFPYNTAKVSVKHRINGTTFSARHPMTKSNSAGDAGNISGFGLVTLNIGDYIQLMVASTAAGGLILSDVNVTVTLIRAL